MRKQFKQLFRGLMELVAVFIAVFVTPAIISAIVNLKVDTYFACVHNAGYAVVMTILGICVCFVYMSMYEEA